MPLTGAAATDAVAVPWRSSTGARERRDVAAGELRVRGVELGVDERDQRARGVTGGGASAGSTTVAPAVAAADSGSSARACDLGAASAFGSA